jgi:hypothetical protein
MFSIDDTTHKLFYDVIFCCYMSQKSIAHRSDSLESEFHSALQEWLNSIIKEQDDETFQINPQLNPSVYVQFTKAVNAFIDIAGSYATSTFLLVSVLDIMLNVKNVGETLRKEKQHSDTTENLCLILGCQMSRVYNVIHDKNSSLNKEDWMGFKNTLTQVLSGCKNRLMLDLVTISVVQRQKENYKATLRFFDVKEENLDILVCDRCYDTYYGCNQCTCDSKDNIVVDQEEVVLDTNKKLVCITKCYLGGI